MFYKDKKVGYNDLVLKHDTLCHPMMNYHNKFGHPASNMAEDMLWTKKSRQTNLEQTYSPLRFHRLGTNKVDMPTEGFLTHF